MAGRPRKYTDEEEFAHKVDAYFDWCDSQVRTYTDKKGNLHTIWKPYTVSGLSLYLDIHPDTLLDYEKNNLLFSSTIKRAKKRIENWIEEHALTREIDNTSAIFNLKNNFGWKDKTEIESHNKNENLNVEVDDDDFIEQLKQKYLKK